jgi:hypothetical protein
VSHGYRHCRMCGGSDFGLLKYGRRHYAHHACYLNAGKKLADLPAWRVGEFPFRLLKERGLEEEALRLTAASIKEARS